MIRICIAGDILTKYSEGMEERDAVIEDPYDLPLMHSLKKYKAVMNGWSIDGLPGLKQVADRATPELVRSTMIEYGLDPPETLPLQRRHSPFPSHKFILGLSVGIVLTIMARDGPRSLTRWPSLLPLTKLFF